MRRLPFIDKNLRILIICEGEEEYDYLVALKRLGVWNNRFSIDIKNAKSLDNIAAIYAYNYQSANFKLVVFFCDTEVEPYLQFCEMKRKIREIHGNKADEHIVFFANPCTMQIILSHFRKVSLKSNAKSENAKLIKELTGVEDYRATAQQRRSICNHISQTNYFEMKNNIECLSQKFEQVPSTNISKLFEVLESGNEKWINSINRQIEK